MESPIRTYAQQLHVEALAAGCHKSTGLPHEEFKDAILNALAAVLARERELQGKFASPVKFFAYIRKAAIREVLRQAGRSQELDEVPGALRDPATPEGEYLMREQRHLASQQLESLEQMVRSGLEAQGKTPETIEHCERLLQEIKADPTKYISQRQSGKHKGQFVFDQSRLVAALGWDKRRVSERLRIIQEVLQRQHRSWLGVEPA